MQDKVVSDKIYPVLQASYNAMQLNFINYYFTTRCKYEHNLSCTIANLHLQCLSMIQL